MNSSYVSLWREKISRRGFNWSFFAILSAVLIVSGFFVPNAQAILSINITNPVGSEDLRGIVDITWTTMGGVEGDTVDIVYSIDDFQNTVAIAVNLPFDGSFPWVTTGVLDENSYKIQVSKHGFPTIHSRTDAFTIDNTPPTITDDYANNGVWVNSAPQTIILSPIDENGISSVETCEGAGCTLGTPLDSPHQLVYSTSQDTIVRYQAWDVAGNPSAIGEFNVRIDLEKPTVSIGGVFSGLIVDKNGVTATVDCSDIGGSDCDVSNYKYKVETIEPTECPTNLAEYTDYTNPVTITDHSWVCAYVKDNAGNEDFSDSPVEFNIFSTIQSAIDTATSGSIINVAAETYNEKLDLKGKQLNIVGASVNGTIVDASSFTDYAIQNFGNLSTVSDLTLIGSDNYGFKVSHVSDITLENIKVENSGKTGIDLNTINGATLNNIEVVNTASGFGLMILDSNNVNVTNITTSGNAWGGVSVQTKNTTSDLITFSGTFDAGDNFPLLLENDPDTDPAGTYYEITNITLPTEFGYVVYDFREGDDYKQWYYFETLDSAKIVAQTFVDSASPVYSDVIIYDILEKNYYVEEGMEIQDAIDAATADDTVSVATGIYNEQLNIEKSLTIIGAGQDNTHIISPNPMTMVIYDYFGSKGDNARYIYHRGTNIPVVRIAASDVTFEGFHVDLDNQVFFDIKGSFSEYYSKGVGILVDHVETTPDIPDLFTGIIIQNNKIDGLLWDDYSDCIKVMAQATVNINNNILYGYGESAVSAQGMDTPRAAFYPIVTANNNIMYSGSDARDGNHYFFGVGYWSGATGSADGNTIHNAPNDNGYALNSWTPNPVTFTNNTILTDDETVGGYGAQLYESSNLIFSGNNIQDQGLASVIWLNPTLTITDNTISNCIDGFLIDNQTSGSVAINNNSITGISDGHYAVKMGGTAEEDSGTIWGSWAGPSTITINASENYWGTAVLITIQNKISDDVIFEPYYVDMVGGTLSNVPVSIVHVDDNYIDGASGGYYFGYDAFDKIQDGIEAVKVGGTVNVLAGNYNEYLDIDEALTLQGAGIGNTIIDMSGEVNPSAQDVVDINLSSENVVFDGFEIKLGENMSAIDPQSSDSSSVITISNNKITGHAGYICLDENIDYGVLVQLNSGKVVISDNNIDTNCNPILLERSPGETDIFGNTLSAKQNSAAIWLMTLYGVDVTALQNIHNNTINILEATTGGIGVRTSPSWVGDSDGKFTNIQITDNTITNVVSGTYGIKIFNDNDGSPGNAEVNGTTITGNTISGSGGTGIILGGLVVDTSINDNNKISGVDEGIKVYEGSTTDDYPTGTLVNENSITDCGTYGLNWLGTETLNAEKNWWGDATGPYHDDTNLSGTGDAVSNNVDFNPFYTDAERLETGLRSSGPINSIEILFDPTSAMVDANSALTLTALDAENYTVVNDDTTQFTLSADNAASFGTNLLTLTTDGTTGTTITNDKTGVVNVTAVLVNSSITATNQIEFTASDVDSPEITGYTPADDSTDVSITIKPTITFSESLAAGTVTSANIQLKAYDTDTAVPAIVSLVEGGTIVVITPNENLENNTQYYFAVSVAVTDLTGNPLSTVLDATNKGDNEFTTVGIEPFIVDDIIAQSSTAVPNNTYEDGWHYTYYLTINATDETDLFVKFMDWLNTTDGVSTILANENMRVLFNGVTGGGLGAIVGDLTNDDIVNGFGSVDSYEIGNDFTDQKIDGVVFGIETGTIDAGSASGRQIQFDVFTKIPTNTVAGAYESDYTFQLGN